MSATHPRRRPGAAGDVRARRRQVRALRTASQLPQLRRARHQGDVRLPEFVVVAGGFGEIRRLAGDIAAGQRTLAEHVAHPVAEAVAHGGDALVGCAAVRAGIAAVLDERDLGARRTEHVVMPGVHRTVEPVARQHRGGASCRSILDFLRRLNRPAVGHDTPAPAYRRRRPQVARAAWRTQCQNRRSSKKHTPSSVSSTAATRRNARTRRAWLVAYELGQVNVVVSEETRQKLLTSDDEIKAERWQRAKRKAASSAAQRAAELACS